MKTKRIFILIIILLFINLGCSFSSAENYVPTTLSVTSTITPQVMTITSNVLHENTTTPTPTMTSTVDSIDGKIHGNLYINDEFNFQFIIPEGWEYYNEDVNTGPDLYRVYFSAPGFIEEVPPFAEFILSVAVMDRSFDLEYQNLSLNVSKEMEKNIVVDGREAIDRIGRHEFGGYLDVVLIPNGENGIELILRTKEEPYLSAFNELLTSFQFIEGSTK